MSAQASYEYVTVRIGEQLFGVPVTEIREVFSPQGVTPVPRAPEEIAGLLNLRGRIVTAIDARRRLGLPPREKGAACMALGMEHGTELFGILVDEVGEVMRLEASTLETVPAHLDARWRAVLTGVHRLDGELLAALDMKKLIAAGNGAIAA
ncbi:chemotaxis protein CheW [Marinicauda algicola]|uniref:Chemotaxis protein CheW n=1 Tax=Marinicauda algicola TaxID=2029849 RepID=A0A4S2GWS3_9PROT|nr:chemotaxis protein CheW [Marinicauda algicola]TGY87537.1 chemotaxis protein CheW [Marinicauda algicola]